jgi:hypothetical protein
MSTAAENDDFDNPWKAMLEHAFPELMAFYFPDAHARIDWTCEHVFLNTELRKIVRVGQAHGRCPGAGDPPRRHRAMGLPPSRGPRPARVRLWEIRGQFTRFFQQGSSEARLSVPSPPLLQKKGAQLIPTKSGS